MSHLEDIQNAVDALIVEQNEAAQEYNELVDVCLSRDDEIIALKLEISSLKDQIIIKDELTDAQQDVIRKAVDVKARDLSSIKLLDAQLKDLKSLDPKRLAKVNKTQKKTIADLKESNTRLNSDRKKAIEDTNRMAKSITANNMAPFYTDAKTGNSIQIIPNLYVGDQNTKGVPDSPVVRFHHVGRGVSREGILGLDGEIIWASAQNSIPTEDDSLVAKEEILSFCRKRKIKV